MTKSITSRFLPSKTYLWADGEMTEEDVGEMPL